MNFKKQAIVAAAILAVAGAANANLQTIQTGANGSSLAFVAVDGTAKKSAVVDLGLLFKDFLPQGTAGTVQIPGDGTVASGFNTNVANPLTYTPGTVLSWNLATNTFKVNGAAQAAVNGKAIDWSQFNSFAAATSSSNTKWGVIGGAYENVNTDPALDVNGYGAIGPYFQIATTGPATATFAADTIAFAGGKVQALFTNNSTSTTSNVASFKSTGSIGYVGNDNEFGLLGNWAGQLAFSALANVGASQNFFWTNEITTDPLGAGKAANVVNYAGTFNFTGSTLTYTVAGSTAAVPEPESIALLFAGLAAIGFAARRRAA